MSDQETKPPPRPRRASSAAVVVVHEVNAAPFQQSYDQSELTRELDRLERGRVQALKAAREAHDAAEAARSEAVEAAEAARAAAPTPAAITRVQWYESAFKLLGALTALIVASTIAIGAWTSSQAAKLDTANVRQSNQADVASALEVRFKKLEANYRAQRKHDDCVNQERDSAIERGTGHVVEGKHDVDWKEQNKPPLKLRLIWQKPPWSPCGGNCEEPDPCPPAPDPLP